MNKIISSLIILSLIISSCRSHQTVATTTDSLSIHAIETRDTVNTCVTFTFDSLVLLNLEPLELLNHGTLEPLNSGTLEPLNSGAHLSRSVIYGGTITSSTTFSHSASMTDSTRNQSATKVQYTVPSYSRSSWIPKFLIPIIFLLLLLLIYKFHRHK